MKPNNERYFIKSYRAVPVELPTFQEIRACFPVNDERTEKRLSDIIEKYRILGQIMKLEQPIDDNTKNTLVHLLARANKAKLLAQCLTAELPLNCRNKFGRTPLLEACVQGSLDAVKVLLENGANVNDRGKNENSALHIASMNDFPEIVLILLEYKAEITTKNFKGMNSIKFAQQHGAV